MRIRSTISKSAAVFVALSLLITGCASSPTSENDATASDSDSAWPRTIEVPAGSATPASTLELDSAPMRIAALDYESAETIAALGLSDRLVLISEAVLNPALGGHIEELSSVETTFSVAMEIDAETVIATAPDLVVMSPRHTNDLPISEVLQDANIPVLQLPEPWRNSAALVANIGLIGLATGNEEEADELAEGIRTGLDEATVQASEDAPRVLIINNQAGRPFVTAGQAYPLELLELAGAVNIAEELGVDRSAPINVEELVQANPDGIVLVDMNGTGDRMFSELLSNPAVASLKAVSDDRLLHIEGKQVQALGLNNTVEGLTILADWVRTL
ncbi:MAG: ABC transporter substrate-binding protein [Microbacteriaceae bacterium]|nr:ABC transporter substrate-binding protein [Microbacteriaceae bacterium]